MMKILKIIENNNLDAKLKMQQISSILEERKDTTKLSGILGLFRSRSRDTMNMYADLYLVVEAYKAQNNLPQPMNIR